MNKLLAGLVGFAGGLIVGLLLGALLGPSFSELAVDRDRLTRENQELTSRLDEVTNEKHKLELELAAFQRQVDGAVKFFTDEHTYLQGEIKQLRERLAGKEPGHKPTEYP